MAITDILSDTSNVSAVIELITLLFIVAGFFRWYDSRYHRIIKDSKTELLEKMDNVKDALGNQLNHLEGRFSKLEDRFNSHIEDAAANEKD